MSLDHESELNLASDAPAVVEFLAGRDGRLHEPLDGQPGVWWAELHPAGDDGHTYVARLAWSVYPGAPPSVKFATAIGGSIDDPTTWPVVNGFRPTNLDICMPFTAEGFAIHPDWSASSQAWVAQGNPFLAVVRELQRQLNSPSYQGRFST